MICKSWQISALNSTSKLQVTYYLHHCWQQVLFWPPFVCLVCLLKE